MSWRYNQRTGELTYGDEVVAIGYSGWGRSKNDPASEGVALWGPIPKGKWTIVGPMDSAAQGLVCFRLTPQDGTLDFGRTGFMIREDSGDPPGNGSRGSIILPRIARLRIATSEDRVLLVF